MASQLTKIPKAINEFKLFLDYNYKTFEEAFKHIRPSEGWHIPYYRNEIFDLIGNLEGNLYEGIYPKLLNENPASDEEILNSFKGSLEFFQNQTNLFSLIIAKKKKKNEEAVLGFPEGITQELLFKAIYKLREVIQIAEEELKSIMKNKKLKGLNESSGLFDIAIITALYDTEYEAFLNLPITFTPYIVPNDPTEYHQTLIGKKRILSATDHSMGMASASALSTKIIAKFSPKYLIMAGIAGGVKSKGRNFGDILIAKQTWNYESGKYSFSRKENRTLFQPDPEQIPLAQKVVTLVNGIKNNNVILTDIFNSFSADVNNLRPKVKPQVIMGPLASGSAVLSEKSKIEDIKHGARKLIGIDMETYGVFYAAEKYDDAKQTIPISIKSISDFADKAKNDNYRKYAAHTSANFIYHFILNKLQ